MTVAGMFDTADLRLAELLAQRLCHELIGPIGAIGNGVELLGEEGGDFGKDAIALVGDSARRAGNRLQFYRFAYGFGRGAASTGPAPRDLATALFEETRIVCEYPQSVAALPPEWHKLACNLLLAGAEGLPRGGRLILAAGLAGPELAAAGEGAQLPPQTLAGLALETAVAELNARTVHAYYTGLLAAAAGCRLVVAEAAPGAFRLAATPR